MNAVPQLKQARAQNDPAAIQAWGEGGSARVAYSLFRDAAYSQSLGIGQSVAVTYSDANNIRLPIYGQVVLPGNQPGGTYSDVLQVQLSW